MFGFDTAMRIRSRASARALNQNQKSVMSVAMICRIMFIGWKFCCSVLSAISYALRLALSSVPHVETAGSLGCRGSLLLDEVDMPLLVFNAALAWAIGASFSFHEGTVSWPRHRQTGEKKSLTSFLTEHRWASLFTGWRASRFQCTQNWSLVSCSSLYLSLPWDG